MRQDGFGFDIFDISGFTVQRIADPDFEEAQRIRAERKAARERAEREERERKARQEREQREREARARSTGYQSPWDVLGVRPGAAKADIRAAWVRLCKQHHPDAGGDPETMKRINRAWQDLKGQMK